jgi:hypothetical protein
LFLFEFAVFLLINICTQPLNFVFSSRIIYD